MKNRIRPLLLLTAVSCLFFAYQTNAADHVSISGASYPDIKFTTTSEENIEQKSLSLKSITALDHAKSITLDGLDSETLDAVLSNDSPRKIIGVPRTVETLQKQSDFQWHEITDGGYSSTLLFTSSGAAALRVGITVTHLPDAAELRFFQENADNKAEVLVTGEEINKLIQLNKRADPDNKDADVYWSPVIEGEYVGVEIYLPPGIDPNEVQIAVQQLSHLAISPFNASEG